MSQDPLRGPRKPDALGRPALGYRCRVEDGELWVGGEPGVSLMAGYLPEEANAAAFVDGWYRTGDIGWLEAEGWVHLTDLSKEMIKVKRPVKTIREPGTPARRAIRYSKPDATSAQHPARCRRATRPISGLDFTE